MWVDLLKEKLEALEKFRIFKSMAKAEKEVMIKYVRIDRGG